MADFDATLVQQILHVTERQWEPNIEHHRQADDFRAALKALERVRFGHSQRYEAALPASTGILLTIPWTGLLVAALTGALVGLLHATLTVSLGLSQHVSGIGITLFASSLSYYLYRLIVVVGDLPPTIEPFRPVDLPVLSDVPILGPILFSQTMPTYLALLSVAVMAYILARTPLGLAIRMTGENPRAVEAQGLNPLRIRIGAVVAGSALMAVGGAFLTTTAFNSFFPEMVQGRGWICIALVVFASWRPGKALIGALLFAFFDAYQLRLQTAIEGVPYQLFLMAPYVLSIAALILVARRAEVPEALMAPYRPGER